MRNNSNPKLLVSKAEASEKIRSRIDIGKELHETQVSYESGFIRLENQTKKWTNYNKTLFHSLFEKSPLPSSHGKSDINITNPVDIWNQKIIKHKQEILYWINDLESIYEQLDLYEELPNNTQQAVDNSPINNENKKCFIGHGGSETDSTTGREILTEGYPIMRIDITGYVTEPPVGYHFTIKVTSDSVEYLSLSNLQVSKKVRIYISPDHYPNDSHTEFKSAKEDRYLREQVDKGLSFANALREGDQIECSVFIVDPKTRAINRNPNDIETYTKFDLWLYPNNGYFGRSESDSRESLKFRKQWRYTCLNREKCEEITGSEWNKYRDKPWINKHPIRTFPRICWIRFKTTVSNLLSKTSATNIIGIIVTIVLGIIGIAVTVWLR